MNRAIELGIGAIILLLLLPVVLCLPHLGQMRQDLREISEDHTVHAQLAHGMYDASRERAFLLFRAVHEEDPFIADEQVMRFRELAGVFAEARQALLKQRLSAEERALLDKQGRAAEVVLLQQDLVLGLLFAGNHDKAQETYINQVLPNQEIVLSMIDRFIKIQQRQILDASRRAAEDGRLAYGFLTLGTALAVLLGLWTGHVLRRWLGALPRFQPSPAEPASA
jgi:hypothetical protein